MNIKTAVPFLVFLFIAAPGCITREVKDQKTVTVTRSSDTKTAAMLDAVHAINRNAPETISASLTIEGSMKMKKFKALGNARFDRKSARMALSFTDFIFKSPITNIFQEGDVLYLYFPVEKKIYRDNVNTINLLNYNTLDLEYGFVRDIATGQIPLLGKYVVKDALVSQNGGQSYLILENETWYETISFSAGQPDRIKLVNRKTREEVEIYLKKKITVNDSSFYRKISIVATNSETRIDISFDSVILNGPLTVQTLRDMKIPREVETVEM